MKKNTVLCGKVGNSFLFLRIFSKRCRELFLIFLYYINFMETDTEEQEENYKKKQNK